MSTNENSIFTNLTGVRSFFEGLGKIYAPATDVDVQHQMIASVNCYWFTPSGAPGNRLIVYLHGGGYVLGSIRSHQALVSHMARNSNTKTLLIDYSLAPEHPYPQALNDVLKVYAELVRISGDSSIYFIGDSAGGGLAVSALGQLQHQHVRQPSGVVLLSPWLNLNTDSPSYANNAAIDPILSPQSVREYALAYNPKHAKEANPSSISFSRFPPVLIIVGTQEILLDDSQFFYEQIQKIQEDSELRVVSGQTHVWMLTSIDHEDSKEALKRIKQFISEKDN